MITKIKICRKEDAKTPLSQMVKKVFVVSCATFIFFSGTFFLFEPGIIKAITDQVLVTLGITSEITISSPSDVTLTSIPGMTGGNSTSNAITWTVVTNDTSGYTLKIEKDQLLQKGAGANQTIANYTETVTGTPDYNWGAVGAGNEEYGFAPSTGTDIVQKFKNNGVACNQSGGSVTDQKCWSPIPTTPTTAETLATSSTYTPDGGTATAIKVKVEVGSSNHLEEGTYTSTITATATTN